MKVRAKNVAIKPHYWHYGVRWPHGEVVEHDLADVDYASIQTNARFVVESVPDVAQIDDGFRDDETPVEKRGPGRPKKVK